MSDIAEKWGKTVAERGFAQVPNHLLLLNQFLSEEGRLSPVELLVLMQLVGSWWRVNELPFPSMRTLAMRCGVSERQILRAVTRLEKLGLLKRVNRRSKGIIAANSYDLQPLVATLQQVAKAFPNEFPRKIASNPTARHGRSLREFVTFSPPVTVSPEVFANPEALSRLFADDDGDAPPEPKKGPKGG